MPRPKKLPYLEALEGNPGKQAIESMGIDAQGEPFIPEHLLDDARGCIEMIKRSMPARVYSALDSFPLAAYGMAWALHKLAAHQLAGLIERIDTVGAHGLTKWLSILNSQATMMVSLGDRLGLDPKSRASLKLPNARQQKSKFDGLIARNVSSGLSNVSPSHPVLGRENRLS